MLKALKTIIIFSSFSLITTTGYTWEYGEAGADFYGSGSTQRADIPPSGGTPTSYQPAAPATSSQPQYFANPQACADYCDSTTSLANTYNSCLKNICNNPAAYGTSVKRRETVETSSESLNGGGTGISGGPSPQVQQQLDRMKAQMDELQRKNDALESEKQEAIAAGQQSTADQLEAQQQEIQELKQQINDQAEQTAAAAEAQGATTGEGSGVAAAGLDATQTMTALSQMNNKIDALQEEYKLSCDAPKDKAEVCCGDSPANCVSESFNTDEKKTNIGVQALGLLMQGSVMFSGSIGQLCGRMSSMSKAATAINGALAATCSRKVGICKRDCGQLLEKLQAQKDEIDRIAESENYQVSYEEIKPLRRLISLTETSIDTCKRADNGTIRAGMAAYSSYQAAKMSDLCKKQAGSGNKGLEIEANSFDVNCAAPGAAANPICQQQCQRPGAENDPICASILQNLAGNNTAPNFSSDEFGADGEAFDVGGLLEDDQEMNVAGTGPDEQGIATAAPGGGGGLGGSGGAGGAGVGGAGSAASGSKARNPSSILKGTSSGNGYSRGGLRTGGTRGGYSSRRGPASKVKKGKKFSLKDFLPGGKANPKRGLAGFAKRNPEIGAKSDDIFNRISARFFEICLKNRLYDCKTITRKRGR